MKRNKHRVMVTELHQSHLVTQQGQEKTCGRSENDQHFHPFFLPLNLFRMWTGLSKSIGAGAHKW